MRVTVDCPICGEEADVTCDPEIDDFGEGPPLGPPRGRQQRLVLNNIRISGMTHRQICADILDFWYRDGPVLTLVKLLEEATWAEVLKHLKQLD